MQEGFGGLGAAAGRSPPGVGFSLPVIQPWRPYLRHLLPCPVGMKHRPSMSFPCNRACSSRTASRVVNTLKDYAVKALVNTVDHLGSVSFKVNGLLDEKVDEVSGTELRVSCIEQRIRTCQAFIDREGLSQQSLVITAPKYHKRYILPVGGSLPESGRHAVAKYQESKILRDSIELQHVQAAIQPTIRDRAPSFRKLRSISPSPSQRARSSSPSRKVRSPSPSPRPGKSLTSTDRRAVSAITTSNPLARSGSFSSRPSLLSSSSIGRRHPSELQKSATMRLHAERNDHKEIDQNPGKNKSFLKSLLSRRKSRKDEMLYSYLDEY
uniref:Protein ABIL3 n=1 Tax=Elaeis guineensis var. tenera TaxID=51953 RepID=A0A6I9QRP8_ELAGV|nr:putative protein ABIL2 isoform X2 [Elaeis guineensis]